MVSAAVFKKAETVSCANISAADFCLFSQTFALSDTKDIRLYVFSVSEYSVRVNGEALFTYKTPQLPGLCFFEEYSISKLCVTGENLLTLIASGASGFGACRVMFSVNTGLYNVVSSGKKTLSRKLKSYSINEFGGAFPELLCDRSAEPIFPTSGNSRCIITEKPENLMLRDIPAPIQQPPEALKPVYLGSFTPGECSTESVFSSVNGASYFQSAELRSLLLYSESDISPDNPLNLCDTSGENICVVLSSDKSVFGSIRLDFAADFGTVIDIAFLSNEYDAVRRSPANPPFKSMRYTATQGRQELCCDFINIGIKCVQLNIHSPRFSIYDACVLPIKMPFVTRNKLLLSERIHSRIFIACRNSLSGCQNEILMTDHMQFPFFNILDARFRLISEYYLYGTGEYGRASLRLLGSSIRSNGMLPLTFPDTGDYTVPIASLVWIISMYDHLLFCGDRNFALSMFPVIRRIISAFEENIDNNGLIRNFVGEGYWNYYESTNGLYGSIQTADNTDKQNLPFILNIYYIMALNAAYHLFSDLRRTDDADRCLKILLRVIPALELFWDSVAQLYSSYIINGKKMHFCEFSQALALASGIARPNREQMLLSALTERREMLVPISNTNLPYRYDALAGSSDTLATGVFNEIIKTYIGKISSPSEMCEKQVPLPCGDEVFNNGRCLDATPIYLYYRYGLGIRPTLRAYSAYAILRRKCGFLTIGEVHTPHMDFVFDKDSVSQIES